MTSPQRLGSGFTRCALLLACLALQSCITASLWGIDLDEDQKKESHAGTSRGWKQRKKKEELSEGTVVYPRGPNHHYRRQDLPRKKDDNGKLGGFLCKVILTPATLILDLVTSPLQASYWNNKSAGSKR